MADDDPADSAPAGDEQAPASSDAPAGPDQPDVGADTGEATAGADTTDDAGSVTHEEHTDPDAVGDFTDPPADLPPLVVDDDQYGGDDVDPEPEDDA